MKLSWRLIDIFLLSCLMLVVVTCGDDDDNDVTTSNLLWSDSASGLMWQNGSDCCHNWDAAVTYCTSLDWGGYVNWRLPTITELRSLIRGCGDVEVDGACGVDDSCLEESCWSESCSGCLDSGPGPDGLFWPSELEGESGRYWASSVNTDDVDRMWSMNFIGGGLSIDRDFEENVVRCVR